MPKCCDITKNRTACYKTAVLGSTRCQKHTVFFSQAGPPVEGKCAMYIEPSPYIELARRCEKATEADGFCAWHQHLDCPHNYQWPRYCHECRVITSRRQEELDRLGTKNDE
jgi:hypothetical protein